MRHKYQHVDHQNNDDLYETLHPSSPLEPKCRLEALFSLLSDLFFWPFRGFYWNPGEIPRNALPGDPLTVSKASLD